MAEKKKDIKIKVFRFDPSVDEKPRYVTYQIPYEKVMEEKMTVLTALLHIYENIDSTLSFQYSCRGGDCHACCVVVNGKACDSCAERVHGDITVEPPIRQGFKIIKDLVATDILMVDKDQFVTRDRHVHSRFYKAYEKARTGAPDD